MMRTTYDKEADAAYVYVKYPVKAGEAAQTIPLDDTIIIDLDKQGRLLGVEILAASKILSKEFILHAEQLK